MKNHNVEAIANPRAARIAPQEGMTGAMRVLYPETSPEQNFHAKVWVGGDSVNTGEYEDEARAVVAYLRSIDDRITSPTGAEQDSNTYQLQQWRSLDLRPDKIPQNYDEKWQLRPLNLGWNPELVCHLRKLRSEDAATTLTFYIDADKFKDNNGNNYEYFVISLDKLEYKLHLLSRFVTHYPEPEDNYTYTHIEENLPMDLIFENTSFDHVDEELMHEENDNNPIVVGPQTLAGAGEVTVNVPGGYYDLEEEDSVWRLNTDFVLVVREKEQQ